jgi:transcriptional regulator with XRE-family HTH domain
MSRQPPHSIDDPSAVIGPRIRELRRARGLTLHELGLESGLTHAFLSQVERGLARPSLRSAGRIAAALGVAIGSLVEPERTGLPRVTRASAPPAIGADSPSTEAAVRALTSEGHQLQATLSDGPIPPTPTFGHTGEELVHVIRGTLAITIADERYVLEPGDTIVFDGRDPHVYEGLGDDHPLLLIVVANADRELPRDGRWPR